MLWFWNDRFDNMIKFVEQIFATMNNQMKQTWLKFLNELLNMLKCSIGSLHFPSCPISQIWFWHFHLRRSWFQFSGMFSRHLRSENICFYFFPISPWWKKKSFCHWNCNQWIVFKHKLYFENLRNKLLNQINRCITLKSSKEYAVLKKRIRMHFNNSFH